MSAWAGMVGANAAKISAPAAIAFKRVVDASRYAIFFRELAPARTHDTTGGVDGAIEDGGREPRTVEAKLAVPKA